MIKEFSNKKLPADEVKTKVKRKEKFHFSGNQIYRPQVVSAESREEAEEVYLKTRIKI